MSRWHHILFPACVAGLIALLAPPAPMLAQAASVRALSLQQALQLATSAPSRAATRKHTEAANAAFSAAGAWPATELSLGTSLRTARLSPTLRLPLPVFGTLSAAGQVARAEFDVARQSEALAILDQRSAIAAAWIELARSEAVATLAAQIAQRELQIASLSQTRFEAGDAPRAEVVGAQAQARSADADASAARAAVAAASAELSGLLGLPPEAALRADGGLPDPQPQDALVILLARVDSHPSARAAAASVTVAARRTELAQAERWPELSLEVGADIDDPTLPGSDLHAGISIGLPLFGKRGAALESTRAEQRATMADEAATRNVLRARAVSAYRRLEAARDHLRALTEAVVPARRQAAELARAAYKEGQQGLAAVLESERGLTEAELSTLEARAQALLAQIDLEASTGGPK